MCDGEAVCDDCLRVRGGLIDGFLSQVEIYNQFLPSALECKYIKPSQLLSLQPLPHPHPPSLIAMATATTPPPYPGLSLEVTVHLEPSSVPEFLALLRPAYESVIAEPECTFFEVFVDPASPGVVHWVEGWSKDANWLMGVQMRKDYYKPYLAATEKMFVKDRKLDFF